jgi:proteasome lid subunit RPN8/RPN11
MLLIKKTEIEAVLKHCGRAYPDEACGILAGKENRVAHVFPMTNAKPGPYSYEMDPEEQISVMREIRKAGLDMLGTFHSHPAGHAYPSSVDVEKAYGPVTRYLGLPEAVYIIVSLMDRAIPVVKTFTITDGVVNEAGLGVLP